MIRIAIIDDHAIVRTALRQYFADQVDLRVVAELPSGLDADSLKDNDVDVVLMDLSMPQHGGVEALASMQSRETKIPVLVLSGYPESHYALALLRDGASGYLNKECEPEEIVKAIRTIALGRKYISESVGILLAEALSQKNDRAAHELLSAREFEVFMGLANGQKICHIAEVMSLSVKTVSTYRTRTLEKMGLTSNSDLTYYALKNGLIA